MTPSGNFGPRVSRRTFLTTTAVGVGGLALTACSKTTTTTPGTTAASVEQSAILAAEAKRPHTGRTVTANLTPQMTQLDLGGPTVRSYAYGDTVPGQVIRAGVGDELAVTVENKMPDPTSVHGHGIALRNDMDGAAPASPDIKPGQSFTYRFSVPHTGTFWAHPHVGGQTDYGLYAPVIVDAPNEPLAYDADRSRPRRRQPRLLDAALPQRLPPGRGHDDQARLPELTPRAGVHHRGRRR